MPTITLEFETFAELQQAVDKLQFSDDGRAYVGPHIAPTATAPSITNPVRGGPAEIVEPTPMPPIPMPPIPAQTVVQDFKADVEVDADGIPWDARIHVKTKTKTKDGHWKRQRGVDEVTFGAVVGELQEKMAATQAPERVADTAPQDPAAVFGQPTAVPQVNPVQPDPNALFGQPAAAAPVEPEQARSWQDICDAAHAAQLAQRCDLEVFTNICLNHGYNPTQHGNGQQNLSRWAEHETDQGTKNAIYDELKALTA